MTTAAELDAARTTGKPDAGTATPPTAGPFVVENLPQQKHAAAGALTPPTAGPAPAPGEPAAGPDAGALLLDLRRLWTRPPTARTTAGKTATRQDTGTGTATPDTGTTGNTSTGTTARTTGTPAPGAQAGKPPPSAFPVGELPQLTPPRGTTARKPTAAELLAARTPQRCRTHTDPLDWLDEPAPRRPGWLLTTCRRCRALVGYRPAEPRTPTRKARR